MKTLLRSLLAFVGLAGFHLSALAITIFQDGFESGSLGNGWTVSGTNNGRITVTQDAAAATGAYDLVLDDSVNDVFYSVAEAILTLDLSNKKNVVLTFSAKSLGNEPDSPPTGNFTTTRAYDGVAISVDGGLTWRAVQSLAAVGTDWTPYTITLDSSVSQLGGTFGPAVRIRFSEYDNASAPLDGIAIDNVTVTADDDQRAAFELPSPLTEGTGPHIGYVVLAFAPTTPLTLSLATTPAGQISAPDTVVVPAGQSYASFEFSVNDNTATDLTRTATFTLTATNVVTTPGNVTIIDDDVPLVTLSLPAQLTEGATPTNNGLITFDRPATIPVTFTLTANPASELTLPSVTMPAGQTQVAFNVRATDDTKIDGNVLVTVTASSPGIAPVTAQTTTIDNESRTLGLTLPATVQEGGTASGTVTIPGTLPTALDVSLSSGTPAAATVPAIVAIPAGQTQAAFTITAVDNTTVDGSRIVNLTAAAATFTSAVKPITVRDNEPGMYRFATLPDIVNVSSPVSITVSAADIEGNVISGLTGTVNLSVVLPDGSTQPLTPATATLSGTGFTGNVTLPVLMSAPLRLRASDSNGITGDSNSFDIMRVIAQTAADLAWDANRARIYASVPATGGTNANKVVAIDPVTMQITGSVTTNQDPGQLALTSGLENAYVALNGNGSVAKINLADLSLALTFAVGTDPSYGTLYAGDICTVAGQPNTVVVEQYRKSVSPSFQAVAAYDNGVVRPVRSPSYPECNRIEPSADPTVFFGYNSDDSGFDFSLLKLDANGVTKTSSVSNGAIFGGYSTDMRSAGNKVFSTTGVAADGSQLKRLGTFATSGPVRPDLAANRVYYLESSTSSSSSYDRLAAYDPTTFNNIRRLSLPAAASSPTGFIRWGVNGLAYRTTAGIILINSSQLVPSDPPADLAVTVQASPNPASVGAPLTYTVQVTNQGPNPSHATLVTTTLSDSQTVLNIAASKGVPVVSGLNVSLPVGDLAVGASATLTLTTSPLSAGSLYCTASASSSAIDPDFTNNAAFTLVSVGFQVAVDVVNQLRFTANNLIYDPTRNLLWAAVPATVAAPLGKSVVSINPATGLLSDPISIGASPYAQSMALSGDGRYLYVGLSDVSAVERIDLSTTPPTLTRIALAASQWGDTNYAEDIEVLDGDGTSLLIAGSSDHAAWVYDTTGARATKTGIYTVDRVERTSTPGTFVGYENYDSGFGVTILLVSSSGVTAGQTVSNLISGYYADIRSSGNLMLSSTGLLCSISPPVLKANLGFSGRPCVDSQYQRAYLVNGNGLRGFDTATGTATGTLTLPTTSTGDWAQTCVRWGLDGFAILGNDGKIYVARWSSTIPASVDQNNDGISDAWAASYFNSLSVNPTGDPDGDGIPNALEYLFVTSPLQNNANSMQFSTQIVGGQTIMHLVFPRRAGVVRPSYSYEVTYDMVHWAPPASVTETVLGTQTIGGVQVETVDAAIPATMAECGFVRLRWLHP